MNERVLMVQELQVRVGLEARGPALQWEWVLQQACLIMG